MPSDSNAAAAVLVARFLKSNNYLQTLDAFLEEAGLPADAGSVSEKKDWTIEKILEEKRVFDAGVSFERLGLEDGDGGEDADRGWSSPAPTGPNILPHSNQANILSVNTINISSPSSEQLKTHILTTTSDRRLNLFSYNGGGDGIPDSSKFNLVASHTSVSDSPILSCTALRQPGTEGSSASGNYVLITSMSGALSLVDVLRGEILSQRKDHTKYCVQGTVSKDGKWIATAGWDGMIFVYRMPEISSSSSSSSSGSQPPRLNSPIAKLKMESNPESIVFIVHPDTGENMLLASRRDSTYLHYYSIPTASSSSPSSSQTPNLTLQSRQNLTPNSNSWNLFTPSHLTPSPLKNDSRIAIATSTTPHMKLMIVRLLFPPPPVVDQTPPIQTTPSPSPPPSQIQTTLLQKKEDAAILLQINTMAPQTPYSTPMAAWRPDASGVWVNGDDGVVRGVEVKTGKVVCVLRGDGGHEVGVKVRCLWAGRRVFGEEEEKEWVCSGGFDRRAVLWECC